MHFVYIVRCADGSLYTGYALDPRARIRVHNTGRGARYTSGRRPVRLVYSESFETLPEALKREYELKQLPRAKKQALIRRTRHESHPGASPPDPLLARSLLARSTAARIASIDFRPPDKNETPSRFAHAPAHDFRPPGPLSYLRYPWLPKSHGSSRSAQAT